MNPRPPAATTTPVHEQRLSTVIVGGQPLLIDLLAAGLRLRGDVHVVTATSSIHVAGAAITTRPPELVVVDLSLADDALPGLVAVLTATAPPPQVITLSEDLVDVERMLRHSRAGRLKGQLHATLDRSATAGDLHLEIDRLIESLGRRPVPIQPQKLLSRRELEVFARMGRGLMNAAIAAELGISQQTVETHRKSISRKLRASRADLVRLAVLHAAQHGDEPAAEATASHRGV